MNFAPAAHDYATFRKGFPDSFFDRVRVEGSVLDLGSGTGTLARGFSARGARCTALDISREMLSQATDLRSRVAARAESCPFRDHSFDAVVAGQCWHWFDGHAAARECVRLLVPGGRLVIARFDYLPLESRIAHETEALILRHNPGWTLAGGNGRYQGWRPGVDAAGFGSLAIFEYDEPIPYTRDAWRGRMRACNGVIAIGAPERMASFDAELEKLLLAHTEPLKIPHRIFVIEGRSPR